MSFNNLKAHIEQVKDKEGQNLLSHLSNIFTKLLLEDPKNPYDAFEDYSHSIKQSKYDFKNHDKLVDNSQRLREKYSEVKDVFQANKKLLDPLMEGEEDNLAPVGALGYVPNFLEEARWFEWAGVGFGSEESYKIFRALTVLSNSKKEKNLKNIRLWGKIHCSQKDYYVAEGQADFEDYGELPPEIEPLGGEEPSVNQLNYFVATDIVKGDWVELPPVSPTQIQTSRRIKYLFTGDLNRKVISNPHFEGYLKSTGTQSSIGTEKELLKCQIVRISYSCAIQPKGLKNIDLEGDPTGRTLSDPDPDTFVFPDFKTLSSLDNWVHSKQNILLEGKMKHTVPDAQEGEEQEEVEKRVQAKDPFEPLLKPLSSDKAPEGYNSGWILRTYGDQADYQVAQKNPAKQNYGHISIKNLTWPGWVAVFYNKKWQSLYIGNGFKQSKQLFFPCEPEVIFEEQPERELQVEPLPPPEKQAESVDGRDPDELEDQ